MVFYQEKLAVFLPSCKGLVRDKRDLTAGLKEKMVS